MQAATLEASRKDSAEIGANERTLYSARLRHNTSVVKWNEVGHGPGAGHRIMMAGRAARDVERPGLRLFRGGG